MQWGKDARLVNEGQELEGGPVTGMQWLEARTRGLSVRIKELGESLAMRPQKLEDT